MKKFLSFMLMATVVAGSLFLVTGCEKDKKESEKKKNTVEISHTLGKGKITLSVPKDEEGNAKYNFTEEKPKEISKSATFYLVTEDTIIGFLTSGMSYNTSKDYKAKYGETKATFEGYLEFIEDKDLFNKSYLPGLEQFEINGRKALRYYNRVGGSGDYKYYGYFYMIGADDIYPGSKVELILNYKTEEKPKEAKEFSDEILNIIKSLKIESNS